MNTEMSMWPTHGEIRPDVVPLTFDAHLLGLATGSLRNALIRGADGWTTTPGVPVDPELPQPVARMATQSRRAGNG
jgi:hypothetical protein